MIPRAFEYYAPKTLRDALKLLSKYKDEGKVLAGGHSLVPLMKLRIMSPAHVIDINRIKGLDYIKADGKSIAIGALTRLYAIESSALLKKKFPILPETVSHIGDPQVRNMGTVGGNLAHCDPANDLPPTFFALKGTIVIQGPKRRRTVKAEKFFIDTFQPDLKYNEILREIRVPAPSRGSGGAFMKLERKAGDFAIASVATQVTLGRNNECIDVGIGLGAVAPTARRAYEAEKVLLNREPLEEVILEASEKAAESADPTSDLRGSAEYKREMVKVLTKRSLRLAVSRAMGKAQ